MLRFSRRTDYALLILTALAARPQVFTSLRCLAREKRLPYRSVAQVVRPLVHRGILASREGVGGGYRLAKDASAITVRDVVAAEEGGTTLVSCLDPAKHYACPQKASCTARAGMPMVQQLMLETLSRHTVADLVAARDREAVSRSLRGPR